MRRLALLLLVLLVGFALLGLLGVFVPPHVSAATPVDRTCMHALRHEGYTFEQRRRKCRIRVRTVGYHAA